MKKTILCCFLILLCLQNLLVKSQEIKKIVDYTGWQNFENSKQKYGFKIPPTWIVHFKNDDGEYIFHSTNDPKDASNLAVEINCKSVPKEYTLDKFFEDSKGAGKSRFKDYSLIDERKDKVNEVDAKWFSFLFSDNNTKKQGAQYCIVYKRMAYNITITANVAIYNDSTEFLTTVLDSFDVLSFQTCAKVTMNPPKDWFSSSDPDSLFLFSAKDTAGKSPSDGVVKVQMRKLSRGHNTHEFLQKIQEEILVERPKVSFSGMSIVPNLNGQKMEYFDIIEKDSDLLERYYVTVYERCGFIIYNIANKAKFESGLKQTIASSLSTFKLEK